MEATQRQFTLFFNNWIAQLEATVGDLISVPREASHEEEHRALIARVMVLYRTYYTAKADAAHGADVLSFFSPSWMSSLGSAYLWFTGWKPSLAFNLVDSLRRGVMGELSEYQLEKVEEVKRKARSEEEKVERRMERLQMDLAGKGVMELARVSSRGEGDLGGDVGLRMKAGMIKGLLEELESVVRRADAIRMKTLVSVIAILSPIQGVDFLTSAVTIQIQIMRWGIIG